MPKQNLHIKIPIMVITNKKRQNWTIPLGRTFGLSDILRGSRTQGVKVVIPTNKDKSSGLISSILKINKLLQDF